MKKKLLATMSALALALTLTTTAFAASPTTEDAVSTAEGQSATVETAEANATITAVTEGITVTEASDSVKAAVKSHVENALKDLKTLGTALGNSAITNSATSANKVTATYLGIKEITADGATQNADGSYTVTLNMSGVAATDTIVIFHYKDDGTWETLSGNAGAGTVTFTTKSFSPFAFVKLSGGEGLSATSTATKSQKDGESVPYGMMIAMIGLAGAAVCVKKFADR